MSEKDPRILQARKEYKHLQQTPREMIAGKLYRLGEEFIRLGNIVQGKYSTRWHETNQKRNEARENLRSKGFTYGESEQVIPYRPGPKKKRTRSDW